MQPNCMRAYRLRPGSASGLWQTGCCTSSSRKCFDVASGAARWPRTGAPREAGCSVACRYSARARDQRFRKHTGRARDCSCRHAAHAALMPVPGEPPGLGLLRSLGMEVVLPFVAVLAAVKLVQHLARKGRQHLQAMSSVDEQGGSAALVTIGDAVPMAFERPVSVLMPLIAGVHALRQTTWVVDAWFHTHHATHTSWLDEWVHWTCKGLLPLDTALTHLAASMMAVLSGWVLLCYKDILVDRWLRKVERAGSSSHSAQLRRVVLPMSSVLTWLSVACMGAVLLTQAGVDLRPLLALGSISGVLLGFATQQLLTNAVAGLMLFVTRPFVVGDTVCLGVGVNSISGVVIAVEPLRTSLASSDGKLVSVPNKAVLDMVVQMASARPLKTDAAEVPAVPPLKLRARLPHAALPSVPRLRADIKRELGADAHLVAGTSVCAELGAVDDSYVQLDVTVPWAAASSDARAALVLQLNQLVQADGGRALTS